MNLKEGKRNNRIKIFKYKIFTSYYSKKTVPEINKWTAPKILDIKQKVQFFLFLLILLSLIFINQIKNGVLINNPYFLRLKIYF